MGSFSWSRFLLAMGLFSASFTFDRALADGIQAAAAAAAVPAWVKPGVRLSSSAQHTVLRFQPDQLTPAQPGDVTQAMVEDPSHPGKWLTIRPTKSEVSSDVTQAQVFAVSGNRALVLSRTWMPTHYALPGGEMRPHPSSLRAWPLPGSIQDLTIDPAALQQGLQHPEPNTQVTRETIQANDHAFPAIRLLYATGPIRNDTFFDPDTGIRLRGTYQAQLPDAEWTFEGQNPRGALVIHHNEFCGIRQVTYPWASKPAPTWIQTAKALKIHYEEVTVNSASPNVPQPMMVDATMAALEHGADYVAFDVSPQNAPRSGELSVGACAAPPGSLFLPPEGLASLKVGQLIDTDPFTKFTVTVKAVERRDGKDIVAFIESGPGLAELSVYDRANGMLLYDQLDTVMLQSTTKSVKVTLTIQ